MDVLTYSVTKLVRGSGGRWHAGRPMVFTDREDALAYAVSFADEQRREHVKGARIVVTQGVKLVREIKV